MAPPDLCRTERPPRRMAVCCFPPYIRRCGSDSSISAGTFRTANPGVGQVAATRHVHTRLFDLLRVVANCVSLPGCLCDVEDREARVSDYGLPKGGAFGRKFWLGSAVGLGGVLLQIALIAALGGYSPGPLALAGGRALQFAFVWAIAFLLAAVNEEFTFRGYLQKTLASGIGFWPTALVLSMVFGALHLGNPGERWPGIVMLFCFGMLAAFTLRVTGDLWFIVGLHAAWDWGHVFLFSVPIAGMRGTQQLLHSSLRGPRWLTGGSAGPDGSVFAFVVLLCITGLVNRVFSSGKRFDIATTGADACRNSAR